MRIIIRPIEPDDKSRLIPADIFKATFSRFLAALKAADKDLNSKANRHDFLILDLKMGSNEIAFAETPRPKASGGESAIDLLKKVTQAVYRSEFDGAADYENLANEIVSLKKVFDPEFSVVAKFSDDEQVPIDKFFVEQVERFSNVVSSTKAKPKFFAGNAIGAFDGRLGNIDYRGSLWVGNLLLQGSEIQIQCIFDRKLGEDNFNPYGNKRVSITGRAIYTGESPLPERIEVMSIEKIDVAESAKDIRGTLSGSNYDGWESGFEDI